MRRLRLWLGILRACAKLPGDLITAWRCTRQGQPMPRIRSRALPDGFQWVGHSGRRARRRTLRQRWAVVQRLQDEESVAVRRRLWAVARMRKDPEFEVQVLASIGLGAAEEARCSWATAMARTLDHMERMA